VIFPLFRGLGQLEHDIFIKAIDVLYDKFKKTEREFKELQKGPLRN